LPDCVVIEAGAGDAAGGLLPEELTATQAWAPHRRAQFSLGRRLARSALRRLGQGPVPILFGAEGEPLWPPGFVGSISHKRECCVVVIATSKKLLGVGVDLERDAQDSAEADIVRRVCASERERAQSRTFAASFASPGTLFLAAKEAFYKFQFPLTRMRLDWEDVVVSFSPPHSFTALERSAPPIVAHGAYVVAEGWIVAAVAKTHGASTG
jgi:4'-phosphopantetheinyl transferase EntD